MDATHNVYRSSGPSSRTPAKAVLHSRERRPRGDVWLGGPDHPDLSLLVTLFGFAGIGTCFFVGQFLDDFVAALTKRLGPRRHIHDGPFSIFITIFRASCSLNPGVTSFALSSGQLVTRSSHCVGWCSAAQPCFFRSVAPVIGSQNAVPEIHSGDR